MSAICGYWSLRREEDPRNAVARMTLSQQPLGPDGCSFHHESAISLAHQSLNITHEDAFEAQPCSSPKPSVLVADARIYNRSELALQFQLPPAEAATLPDSAFVLHAWQRWGIQCVDHLVGAFAFAVWQPQVQRLFLACDHAGERPLFFWRTPNAFAFASTARALLTCPGIGSEVDETTMARDLVGLPPEPSKTRYRDIRQIGPGHSMLVERDAIDPQPRRYWIYDRLPRTRYKRDQDYVDAFLEIFDQAVACRLRTAGKIGCELSAGMDSGAVTATAARQLALQHGTLTAFTAVPRPEFSGITRPDTIADEGPFAAELAALYPNIEHRLVDSSGSGMMREMERAFQFLERPLGAPLNQVWINSIRDQAARLGINVMLNAVQGNATISYAGSDIVGQSFRAGHWIKSLRQALLLRRSGMTSGREVASHTFLSLLPWALRVRLDPYVGSYNLADVAMRPDRERELGLLDKLMRHAASGGTRLPPIMQTIFHWKGIGDHNTMSLAGWGIEQRDPTADKRIFEFCASIPMEQYLVGKPGRSLIRRAMRGRVPDATLDRRTRGMQGADWFENLTPIRNQIAEEISRLESSPGARRLLDLDRMRTAMEQLPLTAEEAHKQSYLYHVVVPDGIAAGYFIRRSEETARQRN